jgi:hypothetical protein
MNTAKQLSDFLENRKLEIIKGLTTAKDYETLRKLQGQYEEVERLINHLQSITN